MFRSERCRLADSSCTTGGAAGTVNLSRRIIHPERNAHQNKIA